MWGELKHMDTKRQDDLTSMLDRRGLNPNYMAALSPIEQEFWKTRWEGHGYIADPTLPQPRSGAPIPKPVASPPPKKEHEAPEEDESPDCLFTDD
ncbi:hypothetical protein RhiJN_18367 [Ceratobasidium sp. AG-Ba]|nr:hypothetical protein RhiJN_18367 [Ceratobasidium sp. AG-Ba]